MTAPACAFSGKSADNTAPHHQRPEIKWPGLNRQRAFDFSHFCHRRQRSFGSLSATTYDPLKIRPIAPPRYWSLAAASCYKPGINWIQTIRAMVQRRRPSTTILCSGHVRWALYGRQGRVQELRVSINQGRGPRNTDPTNSVSGWMRSGARQYIATARAIAVRRVLRARRSPTWRQWRFCATATKIKRAQSTDTTDDQ